MKQYMILKDISKRKNLVAAAKGNSYMLFKQHQFMDKPIGTFKDIKSARGYAKKVFGRNIRLE